MPERSRFLESFVEIDAPESYVNTFGFEGPFGSTEGNEGRETQTFEDLGDTTRYFAISYFDDFADPRRRRRIGHGSRSTRADRAVRDLCAGDEKLELEFEPRPGADRDAVIGQRCPEPAGGRCNDARAEAGAL